eukprot:TRINITY_DN47198_c0_g1_i1.p1 TRINITY_DN47198_c0_g1~~TRINITY_DN47198_c0_g1_i1.p1  ORF type:complete len:447 (+),score=88.30 TRINITY_DN47198_c0_g1_i1:95-1342(+)
MPRAFLPSGQEFQVPGLVHGTSIQQLRQELAQQLGMNPGCLELSAAGQILEDSQVLSAEAEVMVIAQKLSWLDDGSERIQDSGGGEFVVVGEPVKGDTKFNALCDVPFISGKHYFEVQILEGEGCFIGVTTKAGFGSGYKLKGLFYGGPGNLSGGSGGLRTGFGEKTTQGDVIGVELDLTKPEAVGLSFWHGERCLGEAFANCPRQADAAIFPVVSCKRVGDRFRLSTRAKLRTAVTSSTPVPNHWAQGSWALDRLTNSGVDQDIAGMFVGFGGKAAGKGKGASPGAPGPVLTVSKVPGAVPGELQLSMRVCNNLSFRAATPAGAGYQQVLSQVADPQEQVTISPGLSTKMMGPPPLMDLESMICTAMPGVTSWRLIAGSQLELLVDTAVQMGFTKYTLPPVGPVTDVSLPPDSA